VRRRTIHAVHVRRGPRWCSPPHPTAPPRPSDQQLSCNDRTFGWQSHQTNHAVTAHAESLTRQGSHEVEIAALCRSPLPRRRGRLTWDRGPDTEKRPRGVRRAGARPSHQRTLSGHSRDPLAAPFRSKRPPLSAVRFEISEPLAGAAYCHCTAVNDEPAPPPRLPLPSSPGLFESSAVRITFGAGTQVMAPTRHSAAPAAQRCSHRIP
jgi:hypothetical protein